jgi:hypothetical protein
VNRVAINDLVECSIHRWYRTVSEWRGPIKESATGCVSCRASDFAGFDRLGHWPHDLVHTFVSSLEFVTTQLAVTLHEERHRSGEHGRYTPPCRSCAADARSVVTVSAQRHTYDIADVINECAMPRFAAYVEMNANLALNAATRGEWAS